LSVYNLKIAEKHRGTHKPTRAICGHDVCNGSVWLAWFLCWQAVSGFLSVLCEL